MLAIIEHTDMEKNCHMDNAFQFFILMLLKVCLDFGTMYLCYLWPLLSFHNMCSVSVVLVDIILAVFMSATLWLDVHTSHTALCFIMAHFSAAFCALPVTMLCLGILDYYLRDTWAGKKCNNLIRNSVLILLMWTIAWIYAHATVDANLLEQENNVKYLVCEIQESKLVAYSVVVLSTIMFFVLLPYLSFIPQWVKEAERIIDARKGIVETKTNDPIIKITTITPEEDIKFTKEDIAMPRPPMHISLILGFGVFWMPYLVVTTLCVLLEFGIPAYISVNVLWVQCIHSLLEGTVFWLRSDTVGPYTSLPDNVCSWQAYWHLSIGTEANQQQLATVFNPSKGKRSMLFYA